MMLIKCLIIQVRPETLTHWAICWWYWTATKNCLCGLREYTSSNVVTHLCKEIFFKYLHQVRFDNVFATDQPENYHKNIISDVVLPERAGDPFGHLYQCMINRCLKM